MNLCSCCWKLLGSPWMVGSDSREAEPRCAFSRQMEARSRPCRPGCWAGSGGCTGPSAGLHSCWGSLGLLLCFLPALGCFGCLHVLWLQHCRGCFPSVAPVLGPLCPVGLLQCPGQGSVILWASACSPAFISLGCDDESIILSLISWEQPRETPASSFLVFAVWLAQLGVWDLFSRESICSPPTQ